MNTTTSAPASRAVGGWSVANDYLSDPAVAPVRALLAALARRLETRRAARGGPDRATGPRSVREGRDRAKPPLR